MNMNEYRAALANHDWTFDYSDDHNVWKRGVAERKALRSAQLALDADHKVWNELCHQDYKAVQHA